MAIKVKDLIAFLQKHETENWTISYLEFDDYVGLRASLFSNKKEVPNKISYFNDGPAHEWDNLTITTDKDLSNVDIESGHDDDIFE